MSNLQNNVTCIVEITGDICAPGFKSHKNFAWYNDSAQDYGKSNALRTEWCIYASVI